jgi:hypothetical protein
MKGRARKILTFPKTENYNLNFDPTHISIFIKKIKNSNSFSNILLVSPLS